MKSLAIARTVCVVATVCASAFASGVRIADRPQLGSFTTIQAAVDAAVDGETLVVATGTYAPFVIDGKELAVVAAPSANVQVQGPVEVKNLAGPKWVSFVGLTVVGTQIPGVQTSTSGLRLLDNNGHLHFERCTFRGGAGSNGFFGGGYPHNLGHGGDGVELVDCARVAFASCTLEGGAAGSTTARTTKRAAATAATASTRSAERWRCTTAR